MGEKTEIAWCDSTFNPWWGCQRVSPGCEHCYAESFSKRVGFSGPRKPDAQGPIRPEKPVLWGPSAAHRFFGIEHWREPIAWNRQAIEEGRRHRVFCASMADVFERRDDLISWRSMLGELIILTPALDWLLLTKRPENMVELARPFWPGDWPPNVWAGCTVEDQKRATERLKHLVMVPARTRFVSFEPGLECVIFDPFTFGCAIHWIIAGGESGPRARPFHLEWAMVMQSQCEIAQAAFFFKQAGDNPFWRGRPLKLKAPKGGDLDELPEPSLRVRQFPA